MYCLSTRASASAHRWPRRCSQIFRPAPPEDLAPDLQSASAELSLRADSGHNESALTAPWSAEAGGAELPQQPRHNPLDDSEPEEPLDEEPQPLQEEPPQKDVPPAEAHPPPPPPQLPVQVLSWWHRVGEFIPPSELQVGGAVLHHTHRLANFGNSRHRLVICLQCGGTTSGARSPLLAIACRRSIGDTRMRHLSRICLQGIWPQPSQQTEFGRGELSGAIRFQPVGSLLRIVSSAASLDPADTRRSSVGSVDSGTLPSHSSAQRRCPER